jgi:ATP-dependent Lon protease
MSIIRTILLPLRDAILFPSMVASFTFQHDLYIKPLTDSFEADQMLGFVSVKGRTVLVPTHKDLYTIGTMGRVIRYTRDDISSPSRNGKTAWRTKRSPFVKRPSEKSSVSTRARQV